MARLLEVFALLGLYVIIPTLIARLLLRADGRLVLRAYGIWAVILFGAFLAMTRSLEQGLGWAFIFGLFWTIPAIPILVLMLRLWARLQRRGLESRR